VVNAPWKEIAELGFEAALEMALVGTVALQTVEEALEGAILDFLFPSGKTHFVTHAQTLISHSYLQHTFAS
jgi:hypothetical protein